jgi:hypothetical protein
MLIIYIAQHQGHGLLKVKKYTFMSAAELGFSRPSPKDTEGYLSSVTFEISFIQVN